MKRHGVGDIFVIQIFSLKNGMWLKSTVKIDIIKQLKFKSNLRKEKNKKKQPKQHSILLSILVVFSHSIPLRILYCYHIENCLVYCSVPTYWHVFSFECKIF